MGIILTWINVSSSKGIFHTVTLRSLQTLNKSGFAMSFQGTENRSWKGMYAQATYLNQRSGIATNDMEEPTFFPGWRMGKD